jgi:predicted nucleic acid-binding protein
VAKVSAVGLDACVLVPPTLCLLWMRLAEEPRLYRPIWSSRVLEEAHRAWTTRLPRPWPAASADRMLRLLRQAYPEAEISTSPDQEATLRNHPKDRHLLAAAIHGQANTIVTFNRKDFPVSALTPWRMRVLHPDDFLCELSQKHPAESLRRVRGIVGQRTWAETLTALSRHAPMFVASLPKG